MVEESLSERMPGTAVAVDNLPALPRGAVEKWFDASTDGQAVLTGYRLIRDGEWYIKVRLSVPKAGGQIAIDRGMGGLAAVPWTIRRVSALSKSTSRTKPVGFGNLTAHRGH